MSEFSGNWKCTYWWPSNKNPGTEEPSEYTGTLQKSGKQFVFESQPNDEGSYLFARLTFDDDLATGTWWESTSPKGEFKGALYSGAFQALVNDKCDNIAGKWAGVGKNQDTGKKEIYTGRIELTKKI